MSQTFHWTTTASGPLASTAILSAGQNKHGGLWQVNMYGAGMSSIGGPGSVLVYVQWTDRITGSAVSVNTSGIDVNFGHGNTLPVDTVAGTPITVMTRKDLYSPQPGILTYTLRATIEQL